MILVVAGERLAREAIATLVAAQNFQVAGIDCGDELFRRITFQRPTLIVLDCSIQDSFEMLTRIRSDFRSQPIPVIMFSTNDEDVREAALAKGADAYVPKGSLDWAELLAEIKRFARV